MAVHLSLGSNVGDRLDNLKRAVGALEATLGVRVTAVSAVYETDPVGESDQPSFLNAAIEVETALQPLELLAATQDIERRLGRVPTRRWGPRVIDIDIVLWDTVELATPGLTLPHPEFRRRAFVLAPLAEVAPDAVDPVTGATVAQLARSPGAEGRICRLDDAIRVQPPR